MKEKRDRIKHIIKKYNQGTMTDDEKDRAIYEALSQEADQISAEFVDEYIKHNSVLFPNITMNHLWSDCCLWRIDFKCVDDGGLLQDTNPVDKSFQLVRDDGTKAELRIVSKYGSDDHEYLDVFGRKQVNYGHDIFMAIGTLEDVELSNQEPPRPNMQIDVGQNGIEFIYAWSFDIKGKDLLLLKPPRWQPYLEMCSKMDVYRKEEIQKLVKKLLEDED